jgi:hypothetical protein
MRIELDHLFVCAAPNAPEAEQLIQFGLHEGPPNQHPGQGTACRRFSFINAMIELCWVSDLNEVQSESTKRTLLWERWSSRQGSACPFGICVRPVNPQDTGSPFPGWQYRPAYLQAPLSMQISEAGIEEPMWVHLSFMRRTHREGWFTTHPLGVREITRLALTTPTPLRSEASQKIAESGVFTPRTGGSYLLEIEFDGRARNEHVDFRPHLPVIFQL